MLRTPQVIFVTGVMRSGTTLLQRIICLSHRSEYIRKEFDSLHVIIESFQTLTQFEAFDPLTREEYARHYREFISNILHSCKEKFQSRYLVLKDPMALKTLRLFHELMPTTQFAVSVRNPRATCASILQVRDRQREQNKKSFISSMDFGDIVDYVFRLCSVILEMRSETNVCLVRYEDIVMRDRANLEPLQLFLGTELNLDLLDTRDTYNPAHAFWTPESGASITTSSLEKYQDMLSRDQLDLIEHRFANFDIVFGYS